MSDKQDKVIDIIVDKLGVEKNKVTPEANFINDLGADSLDQVELIMELEEEFDLEISDEEAESLTTVSEVLNFLDSK
tara:strand:+ start:430 stop:660 length:231 start_codon:yes stop_codon:yes gene_type:complete